MLIKASNPIKSRDIYLFIVTSNKYYSLDLAGVCHDNNNNCIAITYISVYVISIEQLFLQIGIFYHHFVNQFKV